MARAIEAGVEEFPSINQYHVGLGAAPFTRGDLDAAEEQFERAVTLSRRAGDRIEMAHTLLWLAATHERRGDLDATLAALESACQLVPGLGDSVMSPLVEHLALRPLLPRAPALDTTGRDTVSDAELRVLRMMPGDLSYREIAGELFLSYNTVRTHARQVLRKLAASSRAEAVVRARARNLL
jgi:LuxR family transcriptional regulator, maltose regulon positive regulatory protein